MDLMQNLLKMDPADRLTAKQALMHNFFDGLRTAAEEEQILKDREKSLKRVESNPRVNGTISRTNGEAPRSRSGMRNKPVKQSLVN